MTTVTIPGYRISPATTTEDGAVPNGDLIIIREADGAYVGVVAGNAALTTVRETVAIFEAEHGQPVVEVEQDPPATEDQPVDDAGEDS